MSGILIVGTAWPLTAAVAALVVGRAVSLADRRAADAQSAAPDLVVERALTVA